jgi:hypothetical protein
VVSKDSAGGVFGTLDPEIKSGSYAMDNINSAFQALQADVQGRRQHSHRVPIS